jgi:hypothetical protein
MRRSFRKIPLVISRRRLAEPVACRFHTALAPAAPLRSWQFFLLPLLRSCYSYAATLLHLSISIHQPHSLTIAQTSTYTSTKWARTTVFPRVSGSCPIYTSTFIATAPSPSRAHRFRQAGNRDQWILYRSHPFLESTTASCTTLPAHSYTIGIFGSSTIYPTSLSR